MTRAQFSKIGYAIYGRAWQRDLAEALGVNERTVRNWLGGRSSIPENLPDMLAVLCRERSTLMAKLASDLAR